MGYLVYEPYYKWVFQDMDGSIHKFGKSLKIYSLPYIKNFSNLRDFAQVGNIHPFISLFFVVVLDLPLL
jgi:hypothetical protein